VRECGSSGRTFKSGLLFAVPDSGTAILEAARTLLAWEDIQDDDDSVGQLDESQTRTLNQSLSRAKADFKESIWRSYRHVYFLTKDNTLKDHDLGQITSSMAPSLPDLIINTLVKDDEITERVGANRLTRYWPPALTEWSTKAVRDAFFSSPALPRLLDPDSIKRTIAEAVSGKLVGFARKEGGKLVLKYFGEAIPDADLELSDDAYLLKPDEAQKLVEPPFLDRLSIDPSEVELGPSQKATFKARGQDQYGQSFALSSVGWKAPGCTIDGEGLLTTPETLGQYTVTATVGTAQAEAHVHVVEAETGGGDIDDDDDGKKTKGPKTIRWNGVVPPQKWSNFYMKVVTKFSGVPGLTLRVDLEVPADSERGKAQLDEMKSALRDLSLEEDAHMQ
jgi:hypothetical protein